MAKETFEKQTLKEIAKEFLKKVTFKLDQHTSHKGEIIEEGASVSLLTPSHIQFAVYGRGPGKRPPLDPILAWVKREKIRFAKLSDRGTAFAIMSSIGKKGTKNWKKNAPNALEEAINENLDEYREKLADSVSIIIQDEMRQITKTIKPNENFKY